MPFTEPPHTQPLANREEDNNRTYIQGTWETDPIPPTTPLVEGGYEVSNTDGPIATRGFNRPDQRYELPAETLRSRRQLRAAQEYADTVILEGANGKIEMRVISGNNYNLSSDGLTCDCPDYWRLRESGYDDVPCKHSYMATEKLSVLGPVELWPKSTGYVAEILGVSIRTVQQLCHEGIISAIKVHEVWMIPWNATSQQQIADYATRLIDQEHIPDVP